MALPTSDPARAGALGALAVLGSAARALHAAHTRADAVAFAARALLELTGARTAGVCLLDDTVARWTTAGGNDLATLGDPRHHKELASAAVGDGPASAVAADGSVLLAVPVLGPGDLPTGIAVVGASEPVTSDGVEGMVALAAHLGVALSNQRRLAELQEAGTARGEIVDRLQEALRPPTPVVANTELGVSYEAADPGAPTGGDLWDWVVLPDGDLHIAVVDVLGKGVAATKDALAIVHALRMLVFEEFALEDVVRRADALLGPSNPELVATILVVRYSPRTGHVRLVGAGHPPALLVSGGAVTELEAPGIPLGWPGAGSAGVCEVALGRSDSLILYTDGLIEARKDVITGLETLRRYALETVRYPATQQARVLVDRVLHSAARRDDSLVLVLRRRTPPEQAVKPLGPFAHRLAATPAAVSTARGLLGDWLHAVPVDAAGAEDLLLIATELCTNAIEHASWQAGGVALRAWCDGSDVLLEVEDDGGGLHWPTLRDTPPDPTAEQGRGLWLVHVLSDEVEPSIAPDRTRVRVRKRNISPRAR